MSRPSILAVAIIGALGLAPLHRAAAQTTTAKAIDRANMDTTCSACADFFEFANGGWLRAAQIPASKTSLGSFGMLSDRNEAVVHGILDDDAAAVRAAAAKPGTSQWKIGTFYASCLDTVGIAARGIEPLRPMLDSIAAIRFTTDLVRVIGVAEREVGVAPFAVGPAPDPKNNKETIVSASQGGLGLPDREYYLKSDTRSEELRREYVEHVSRTLQLIGEPATQAAADADTVMAVETALAAAALPRVAMRDPNAVYHKMTLAEFQRLTPRVAWQVYLATVGGARAKTVNVRTPAFFAALDSLLGVIPLPEWKTYLRWHVSRNAAPLLGPTFVAEDFRFNSTVMRGVTEQEPRWRRCANSTNTALGWAVGEEYVRRDFTPEARARAAQMVDNLVNALRERIAQLDWMSAATKAQATAKLDAFLRKVAYPDVWRDYSTLFVKPGAYYENVAVAGEWNRQRGWARLGKPVDRAEWSMVPPTVNASYSSTLNQIQFPAGILQPPFFDPTADDAVNYGGIGAVIGHEMSHGFDDSGRQFDAQGNLRDWWTPEDATKYKAEAERIVDQFNGYTVIDSTTHVNGRLTLGENIGDLGGLTVAYAALEKTLAARRARGEQVPEIDGFTPEQRFFLSWARIWREIQRPEAQRLQIATNPHSPGKWRVNGPLSNMPEFKQAWGCKEGDPMVRPDSVRARIW
ncbi:MAG TPA: M13 family metallopeptidase [Gemmatimonadaceae bacterium]|nr:M13 family metallopeptidase [Gemmatimonadaceae bacterium]